MQRNVKECKGTFQGRPRKKNVKLTHFSQARVSGWVFNQYMYNHIYNIGGKGLLVWFSAYFTLEGAPIQFLRHAELPPHCQPSRAMEIGSLGANSTQPAPAVRTLRQCLILKLVRELPVNDLGGGLLYFSSIFSLWFFGTHIFICETQMLRCVCLVSHIFPNQHNSSAFCRCWNDVQDLFLKFLIRVRLVLGFAEYKPSTHFPEQLCFFYSTSNVILVEIHHAQMPNAIGSRSFKLTNSSIRTEGSKSYSATYLPVPSWCLETRATENTVQTKVRWRATAQGCVLRFELICPDMSKNQSSQVAKWQHVFFVHQNESSSENMPRRIFNRTCATDPKIIHYVLQCCVLICFEVKISKQMKRHRNIEKKTHKAPTISYSLKSFGTCDLRW